MLLFDIKGVFIFVNLGFCLFGQLINFSLVLVSP